MDLRVIFVFTQGPPAKENRDLGKGFKKESRKFS
jgi:hypothetical protein